MICFRLNPELLALIIQVIILKIGAEVGEVHNTIGIGGFMFSALVFGEITTSLVLRIPNKGVKSVVFGINPRLIQICGSFLVRKGSEIGLK